MQVCKYVCKNSASVCVARVCAKGKDGVWLGASEREREKVCVCVCVVH